MKLDWRFDKMVGWFTIIWIIIFAILGLFFPAITLWMIFLPLIIQFGIILLTGGVLIVFFYLLILFAIIGEIWK